MERQRAIYQFIIYRAEDLPRTNLGLFASVKKAIGGAPEAFIDAMVKIHFAGQVVRTPSTRAPSPRRSRHIVPPLSLHPPSHPPLRSRPIVPPLPPHPVTSSAAVVAVQDVVAEALPPGVARGDRLRRHVPAAL